MQKQIQPAAKGTALLPLVLFLILFVGTGTVLTLNGTEMAFYQLSAAVAILPAIAMALTMGKNRLNDKINTFLRGVGDINIITMCMIYLLAGAFAAVAKSIGGVEATINLGLSYIPVQLVLPGLFVIAAFVATAMGTSMGTIAAIAPIAAGIATQTDIGAPLLMGTVVGGAMFGDNLSMISDTTIAATRTQGCRMGDKFRMNLLIVAPAALLVVIALALFGSAGEAVASGDWQLLRVIPYLIILALALAGINVFVVLASGIVLAGAVGLISVPDYSLLKYAGDIYNGFSGMHEIMVLSMLVGGLGELMRVNGGLQWLLERINALAHKSEGKNRRRSGEVAISSLVALTDLCTANNTVAIILSGGLAKDIARDTGVDPRRSASLLDIFSCVVQGIAPYAAQVLLAGSIAGISPVAVASSNWYCLILAVVASVAIVTDWPRITSKGSTSAA